MVQAQRTYTKHTSTEIARCVGCLCTSSGWFKHSEPPRTYTLNTLTEIARCVGCFCSSSGWFKHSEPIRTYTNHTSTELARCVGCFCTSSGWVKHSKPTRTHTRTGLCTTSVASDPFVPWEEVCTRTLRCLCALVYSKEA